MLFLGARAKLANGCRRPFPRAFLERVPRVRRRRNIIIASIKTHASVPNITVSATQQFRLVFPDLAPERERIAAAERSIHFFPPGRIITRVHSYYYCTVRC